MRINVLAFGQIAEITGKAEWITEDFQTTSALYNGLIQKYPELKVMNMAIAVNKQIVHSDRILQEGDTVALMPPFSGG